MLNRLTFSGTPNDEQHPRAIVPSLVSGPVWYPVPIDKRDTRKTQGGRKAGMEMENEEIEGHEGNKKR